MLLCYVGKGGRVGRYRSNGQVRVGVRARCRRESVLPTRFWVGQQQGGDEQVCGGDQGGVVVPAQPGASLEMIESETGFHPGSRARCASGSSPGAPARAAGCPREGSRASSRWARRRRSAIPRSAHRGQGAVLGAGDVAVRRADSHRGEPRTHRRGRIGRIGRIGLAAVAPGHGPQGLTTGCPDQVLAARGRARVAGCRRASATGVDRGLGDRVAGIGTGGALDCDDVIDAPLGQREPERGASP